jgi:hypothetical protein
VRDQVSHPYSKTGKITLLYILIFRFFDMRREKKILLNNNKHSPNFIPQLAIFIHEVLTKERGLYLLHSNMMMIMIRIRDREIYFMLRTF